MIQIMKCEQKCNEHKKIQQNDTLKLEGGLTKIF